MTPRNDDDRGGPLRPERGRRPHSDRGQAGRGAERGFGRGGPARPRREDGGDPGWPAPFDPTRETRGEPVRAPRGEPAGTQPQDDDPEFLEEGQAGAVGAEHGGARPGQPSADVRSVQLDSDEEVTAGPWIFARQVRDFLARPLDGTIVEVLDRSGRFLGHGLYNSASDIRVRMLSRGRRTELEKPRQFLLKRLKSADDLRRKWLRLPDVTDAYRVAHAEGDDLPGLIVDRLG